MDLFHVSDHPYTKGDIIMSGHYGNSILRAAHTADNDPNNEFLREKIREIHYPNKPSRFRSSFVWESLEDAIFFRDNFRSGSVHYPTSSTIYKVDFCDPNAVVHKVCYTMWSPDHPNLELQAHEFWKCPRIYSHHMELFAETNLVVIDIPIPRFL